MIRQIGYVLLNSRDAFHVTRYPFSIPMEAVDSWELSDNGTVVEAKTGGVQS